MLLLEDDVQISFNDHLDADIVYTLPHAVTVNETDSGTPDFFLLRYAGDFATERGGILRGTLKLLYPADPLDALPTGDMPSSGSSLPATGILPIGNPLPTGDTVVSDETAPSRDAVVPASTDGGGVRDAVRLRPVPFMAGYSRLCLRPFGGGDVQTGQWHKIDALEQGDVTMLAYLDASETEILRSLFSDGSQAVSMELYLVYRGLVAGIPWLVRADTRSLNSHMQIHLGEEPATVDHVVAAFLSLPEGVLDWSRIADDGVDDRPAMSSSTMRTQAALHALEHLFEPVDRPDVMSPLRYRYVPRDSAIAPTFSYALFAYRQEERTYSIDWSISSLLDELDSEEREALFPTVTRVSPFERVRIHVVNSLVFDPAYLTSVTVDVKNVGPQGTFENRSFRFSAGSKQVESFSTFQPVLTSGLDVQYRITAVLAPPSVHEWPVVIRRDFCANDGVVIDVNRETAGIDFVHCSADAGVFSRAGSVDVTLALPDGEEPLAQTRLTNEHPAVRIALPDVKPKTTLSITCRAHPPADVDAEPIILRDDLLTGREVVIPAYRLEVLDPDEITATLDEQARDHYPFVALEITSDRNADEGVLRTLDPGRTQIWHILRESVFSRLQYRYRLHVVAKDEEGNTLPMVRTSWFDASAHDQAVTADFIAEHTNPP